MTSYEKCFFCVVLVAQWFLSLYTHNPLVGFDDANITQAYAQHISQGHVYGYNIGGERVEGSTSILWTVINVLIFFTPFPIELLHALSFLIIAGIMVVSTLITKEITSNNNAAFINLALFNFFPFFFGWGFFSLMDIALFIFFIVLSVYLLLKSDTLKPSKVLLSVSFLLPLTRPEGILVSVGIFLLWTFFNAQSNKRIIARLTVLLTAVGSLLLATGFRLIYFGYPFPNTYYAKTSSDHFGQLLQGLGYLIRTLKEPQLFALLILFALAVIFYGSKKNAFITKYIHAVSLLTAGAIVTYCFLGGDHFRGGRFYQFAIPLFLPVISAFVTDIVIKPSNRASATSLIIGCTIIFTHFFIISAIYYNSGGGFRHEFRIAENGRKQGRYLNKLLGEKFTLGVIASGGTRVGYNGTVYDLLGLNWVEMAHSVSGTKTNVLKNHGGFDKYIFLKTQPDIFSPKMQSCDETIKSGYFGDFLQSSTQQVTLSNEFKRLYNIFCNEEVTFYGLRKNKEKFISVGLVNL